MSDSSETQDALANLKALQRAISQPKSPGAFSVQAVDTYLLLHVAAVTFAAGLGACDLTSGLTSISPTGDLLLLGKPVNAGFRWPLIELSGAILAFALLVAYGFIAFRSRQERVGFREFSDRHFEYFRNFAAISDVLIKFAVFALLTLAGKTEWIAPVFMLFVGDIVFQGRLLALTPVAASVAGAACFEVAFVLFAHGNGSLLWPIAAGIIVSAWSLARIVRFRRLLLAGEA